MATTSGGYAVLPADTDDAEHASRGYQPMNDSGSVLPVASYHPQTDGYLHHPAPLGPSQPPSVASFYPPLGYVPPAGVSAPIASSSSSSVPQTSIYIPPVAPSSSTGAGRDRGASNDGRAPSSGRNSLVGVPLHKGNESSAARFAAATGCKDVFWAILFIVHLFVIFVIACATYDKYRHRIDKTRAYISMDSDGWSLVFIFILTGMISSILWLGIIRDHASCLIWLTLLLSTASALISSITFYSMADYYAGTLFLLIAIAHGIYCYFIRNRIEFSATILSLVSESLRLYNGTFLVALVAVGVQALWLLFWSMAVFSSLWDLHRNKDVTNGTLVTVYFFFLVSFFWTSQVISNVVHVTTAGVISSWYFLAPSYISQRPTITALKRATWANFGSICLGSLLIAIVKAARALFQQMKKKLKNNCARCFIECMLRTIEGIIGYFNIYAFTYVAIYGDTYCASAKAAWTLLRRRGIDAVANDSLIGGVLHFACLIGGCTVGLVGSLAAKYAFDVQEGWQYWGSVGFVVGLAMTSIAMEVVFSGVCALFVCFADDPAALRDSKPEVYERLRSVIAGHRYGYKVPGIEY